MEMQSIMIVGVGGQGTLLASRILGSVSLSRGYDVKISEVHGMAQRGGSVVTYVKTAGEVMSPVIAKGEADVILAFEELEAARWLPYLKKDGTMIINTQKIEPMTVITGATEYPDGLCAEIEGKAKGTVCVDGLALACKAGNPKAVNVVLIGVLAALCKTDKGMWTRAVEEMVPEKFKEVNLRAFELGYESQ
ncbi:MAG: indolepyruvate oxidoreductase subunit beta [Clostridia bacterium]